jgi:hypothetical protein
LVQKAKKPFQHSTTISRVDFSARFLSTTKKKQIHSHSHRHNDATGKMCAVRASAVNFPTKPHPRWVGDKCQCVCLPSVHVFVYRTNTSTPDRFVFKKAIKLISTRGFYQSSSFCIVSDGWREMQGEHFFLLVGFV